jgi:hypothetical protein
MFARDNGILLGELCLPGGPSKPTIDGIEMVDPEMVEDIIGTFASVRQLKMVKGLGTKALWQPVNSGEPEETPVAA